VILILIRKKILEFSAECVKEGNTFWRTKAALEALVDQYRSSDDEDYRSNLCCGSGLDEIRYSDP
jgi:hypothetical protein